MTDKGRRFAQLMQEKPIHFQETRINTFQNAQTSEWTVHIDFGGGREVSYGEQSARMVLHMLEQALLGIEKLRAAGLQGG